MKNIERGIIELLAMRLYETHDSAYIDGRNRTKRPWSSLTEGERDDWRSIASRHMEGDGTAITDSLSLR